MSISTTSPIKRVKKTSVVITLIQKSFDKSPPESTLTETNTSGLEVTDEQVKKLTDEVNESIKKWISGWPARRSTTSRTA
jgi:hypothetical protein